MTLGLAATMVVGMAVTIGIYVSSKQHLAVLADGVAKQVKIEIENIRNKSAESEERLIHTFMNWAAKDETLQQYHAERSALFTVDGANNSWDWAEPEIQRWAEERRRTHCAAGQRSMLVSASLAVLGLWCAIAVVTLLSFQRSGTQTVTPIAGSLGVDRPWARGTVLRSHSFLGLKTGECET
ncbi:MAG: hypothetical protein IIA66_07410 [Planctomycetes bacterium]|nr:hypothetical protein [Planctomycetota bacterium]